MDAKNLVEYLVQQAYGAGPPAPPNLPPRENGGSGSNMEPRVARLESDMEHVKKSLEKLDARVETMRSDLGTVRIDVGQLKTKVEHLPSKGFVVTTGVGTVTALTAILILLQRLGVLQ